MIYDRIIMSKIVLCVQYYTCNCMYNTVSRNSSNTALYSTVHAIRSPSPEHNNVCIVLYSNYRPVLNPKRPAWLAHREDPHKTKGYVLSLGSSNEAGTLSKYYTTKQWDVAKRDMWDPVLTCSFCLLACIKGVRIGVKSIQV